MPPKIKCAHGCGRDAGTRCVYNMTPLCGAEPVAIALNMIAGRDDVVPNQVIALSAAGQFEALSKICSGVSMLL